MTEPPRPPGYQHAVYGVEHLVYDGTRWASCDDTRSPLIGWAKTAEAAQQYAELLAHTRVPWPDSRVRMNETVVVTTYRPEPDPELAGDWQRFIDGFATVSPPCDEAGG